MTILVNSKLLLNMENVIDVASFWFVLAIVFFTLEIMTTGFAVLCFGIGSLLAGLAAYFDLSLAWQLVFFIVGSVLSFLFARPVFLKYMYRNGPVVKTNTDALIGRRARVSETINNREGIGRVEIDGDSWRARNEIDEIVEAGGFVTVVSIDNIILTVKQEKL